jgi:hypothetical protein
LLIELSAWLGELPEKICVPEVQKPDEIPRSAALYKLRL